MDSRGRARGTRPACCCCEPCAAGEAEAGCSVLIVLLWLRGRGGLPGLIVMVVINEYGRVNEFVLMSLLALRLL